MPTPWIATTCNFGWRQKLLQTSITISSDFRTATLIAALPPETEVTITATVGAESLFGVPLAEFQSQFRTAAQDRQPADLHQFPVSGAGRVPPETPLLLEPELSQDSSTAISGLRVAQDGDPVQGTTRTAEGATRFTPASPFTAGAAVTLSIAPQPGDTSVNALAGYSGVFVVAGTKNTVPDSRTSISRQIGPGGAETGRGD